MMAVLLKVPGTQLVKDGDTGAASGFLFGGLGALIWALEIMWILGGPGKANTSVQPGAVYHRGLANCRLLPSVCWCYCLNPPQPPTPHPTPGRGGRLIIIRTISSGAEPRAARVFLVRPI